MTKATLERMLNTEMDVHLGRKGSRAAAVAVSREGTGDDGASAPDGTVKRSPNRRHGRSRKTVQGDLGEVRLTTPRDRDGTFAPLVIGKHQRRVPGFDEKILALFAKGMTTRDIPEIVQELYGVEVSPTLISEITSDLDTEVTAWRTRPLEANLADRLLRRHRGARAGWPWAGLAAHDLRRLGRKSRRSEGTPGTVAP